MKKQLKTAIALSIMLLATNKINAQSGIYKTADDYHNSKLTYETKCSGKHTNIKQRNFFGYTPYLSVTENGVKHKLNKNDVYGYKDCNNKVYRFYNNRAYKITEAGNIYIYVAQENITQSKGYKVVNVYYFSSSPSSPILPLTYSNLAGTYAANEPFCDKLEQAAATNDAAAYDTRHNTYKINYLFSKSISQ